MAALKPVKYKKQNLQHLIRFSYSSLKVKTNINKLEEKIRKLQIQTMLLVYPQVVVVSQSRFKCWILYSFISYLWAYHNNSYQKPNWHFRYFLIDWKIKTIWYISQVFKKNGLVIVSARQLPVFQASSSIESCSFLNCIGENSNLERLNAVTNSLVWICGSQSHSSWWWELCTTDFRMKNSIEITSITIAA